MNDIPEIFPAHLIDYLADKVQLDFIQIDKDRCRLINSEAGVNYKTHLIMPRPVSNSEFLTVLNALLGYGLLRVSEKSPPPDPFGLGLFNKNMLEVSYITKKGLFGQKCTDPIIVIENYLPGKTHYSHSGILYDGEQFMLLGENNGNKPVKDVSIYGALLFANICGFQIPTRLQWEEGVSSLPRGRKPGVVIENPEVGEDPVLSWIETIELSTCLRFSRGAWSPCEIGEVKNTELGWEYTSERVSAVHYQDLYSPHSHARGSFKVMKLDIKSGELVLRSNQVPAIPESTSSSCSFRLVYLTTNKIDSK
jgi:hypothetical protein